MIDVLEIQSVRGRWFRGGTLVLFLLLVLRFFDMQIWRQNAYVRYSEANILRRIPVAAPRGLIYDRLGRVIVDNRPSYSLFIIPHRFISDSALVSRLAVQTGMREQEIFEKVTKGGGNPFHPVRLLRDMDFETLTRIEENREMLPGLTVQVEPVRAYSDTVRLSHVLGYVGEADKKDLIREKGLQLGDLVGKQGLEHRYDTSLRGQRGYRLSLVDAVGREVDQFGETEDIKAVPGLDLRLSIDMGLQHLAESLLQGKRGVVIGMNPQNGHVLAMASAPDFPLTVFARHLAPEVWDQLLNDENHPLLHRAIQAQIPPGSIYKPVTALAGFELSLIQLQDSVRCEGGFMIGRRFFPCWKPEGHGSVNFSKAIAQSCNSYFYRLSQNLSFDTWAHWGALLGVGERTGIDLDEETSGLLPESRYLDKKYGKGRWSLGQIANLAIGQGDLLVTPMQMACLVSTLAMKGRRVQPSLVQGIETEDDADRSIESISTSVEFPPSALDAILLGMKMAVESPGGTARAAGCNGQMIFGKTGSAQNPWGDSHAWFIGFTEVEGTFLSLAVVIENGGSGGQVAAPIAGQLFKYFKTGMIK